MQEYTIYYGSSHPSLYQAVVENYDGGYDSC